MPTTSGSPSPPADHHHGGRPLSFLCASSTLVFLRLRRDGFPCLLPFLLQGNGIGEVDMDATMATLGPEDDTTQGLILPSKVMYRPQAGKSVLGMNLVLVRCLLMDPMLLVVCFFPH